MERGCEEMAIISSQPFLYVFIFLGGVKITNIPPVVTSRVAR